MTTKTPLTLRSKITIRWTTAPADMGYGGTPTRWRSEPGETMSLRKAAQFAGALSEQIGAGTYRLIEYYHKGQQIDLAAIHEALAEAEWCKDQRHTTEGTKP